MLRRERIGSHLPGGKREGALTFFSSLRLELGGKAEEAEPAVHTQSQSFAELFFTADPARGASRSSKHMSLHPAKGFSELLDISGGLKASGAIH